MNRKKNLWAIVSLLIAIGSIVLVLNKSKSFKIETFWANIQGMDKRWMAFAVLCMFGFIWFEGQAILRIAKTLNIRRSAGNGLLYGAADVYFSAITPSASGGQPASAYFMMKDGMGGSASMVILLFNLIFYCLALLSVAIVDLCVFGGILFQLSIKFKILYVFGLVILIVLAGTFYLMIQKGQIIFRFADRMIRFGEKIHVIRNGQKKREKLLSSMKNYHNCADIIAKDKRVVLDVFFYNVLQRLSQLAVTFCVFMAWNKNWLLAIKATGIQCFVAVGSNSIPIPGAMGVADYLMLNGFTHLLGETMAVNMELICRGITFYGCVLTGGIITVIGYLRREKKYVGIL